MNDKPITSSRRLAHNALSNIATLVINSVIQFFLIRFFLGRLGEKRYGVWLLIASLFQYRDLIGMGLNSAVNRYIPVYLAKGDKEGIRRVFNTTFFFLLLPAVILVLLTLVVSYNIGSWFMLDPELVGVASRLALVVGICAAFATPMQLSSAVLSGLQRYELMNISVIIPLFVRTGLVIVVLLHGYGLVTMGLIFGLSGIAMRLLQMVFVRRLLPQVRLSLTDIDLKLFKEMLAYGTNTFLYAVGAILIYKASDVIIGIFVGTAEVTQFGITMAAVLLLSQFLQASTQAMKPAVSELDARDEHSRVREMSFLMQKYSLLLIIPAGSFLIIMGKYFLRVWVGEKFQDPTVIDVMSTILVILTLGHCLRLAQHSNFLVLVGKGEHKIFGRLTVMTAVFCVALSIFSIKVLKMGLVGIAWSNFLPLAVTSGLILPIYFNWKMHITTKESVTRVWLPALLGTLPAVAVTGIWRLVAPPDHWIEILGVVVASAVMTLAGSWLFSFSNQERKRFLKVVVRG